jgi:hypothetical protein
MRATHDSLRRLVILLLRVLFFGTWLTLVIDLILNPSLPSQSWQFAIGGVAIVSWAISRVLIGRAKAIEESRDAVFAGGHRMYYTVPLDYSYQVVFTPTMLRAMQDPETGAYVSGRVDALLCNGVPESHDNCIRDKSESVTAIGHRFEASVGIIDMVETLCNGLGIEQPEHFAALRTAAHKKLQWELDEALRRHDAEAAALAELRQLR